MITCHVIDRGVLPYEDAFVLQKEAVARVDSGGSESLYLLEHPHVITIGRNADGSAITADRALIAGRGVAVAETDRGGDVTYHGPGQLVGYPVIRLEEGRRDIRRYVHDLEDVLIRTLADFGVEARRHPDHRGVWVDGRKIASLGIRISRWVTSHGFALNVNTDLSYFGLMTPCGIDGCEMTSMGRETGVEVAMDSVKHAVRRHFADVFGREVVTIASGAGKARAHA